ncbi:retrovirus-related pol polyprotein from transposon TNT 1-94, partial [Tanacetum coccineum]
MGVLYNKTPYELFLGRKLALGFIRPFGCPVTILNTIDHLGKFDGKDDEGFFVGHSINSKAFRVFSSRTRIVEENLHVQFSENTPNIEISLMVMQVQKHVMMQEIMKRRLLKNQEKKVVIQVMIKRKRMIMLTTLTMLITASNGNNTNNVNVVSLTVNTAGIEVNVVSNNTSIKLPNDPNMPELEDIMYSDDYEDVGAEA